MDTTATIGWIIRLAAIGICIDSIEKLAARHMFSDDGLLGWPWLRTRRRVLYLPGLALLLGYRGFVLLLMARAAASAALIVLPVHPLVSAIGLPIVLSVGLLSHLRSLQYGHKGADRMLVIVLGALVLWRLRWDSHTVSIATIWFIALQGCLSYLTAGWIKLAHPAWRTGSAVGDILAVGYMGGPPGLGVWLQRHTPVNRLVTWGALAAESTFAAVLILPLPVPFVYLGWGLCFHLLNAACIGLNTFFWAWLAVYPAILYIVLQ